MPGARRRRLAGAVLALAAAGGGGGAAAAELDDFFLGSAEIKCAKAVRIHGEHTQYYPLGKTENISLAVPSDVIVYECGYRRARLICAPETTRIEFRRTTSRGAIYVKCYGLEPLRYGVPGAAGEGSVESGEGATDAPGTAPPPE